MGLERYGIDEAILREMYQTWLDGDLSKSALEQRYLGTSSHHGKLFTRLVRQHLGIETGKQHAMSRRNELLMREVGRLRRLVEQLGGDASASSLVAVDHLFWPGELESERESRGSG
jgi:hypothetical protein